MSTSSFGSTALTHTSMGMTTTCSSSRARTVAPSTSTLWAVIPWRSSSPTASTKMCAASRKVSLPRSIPTLRQRRTSSRTERRLRCQTNRKDATCSTSPLALVRRPGSRAIRTSPSQSRTHTARSFTPDQAFLPSRPRASGCASCFAMLRRPSSTTGSSPRREHDSNAASRATYHTNSIGRPTRCPCTHGRKAQERPRDAAGAFATGNVPTTCLHPAPLYTLNWLERTM
mmetsp:Transcript_12277/g.51680  ORF Transcript_12277/g.51680 Transcript_12277/m.51680 type:complete len:229 (+) Transcript_12277:826-1512(+)